MTSVTIQTIEELELLAKSLEVIFHPVWQGVIDEKKSLALLENKPIMTYLLRQGSEGEHDYWLSHKMSDGKIHHRHFTIKLFSDGWFFVNERAPSHRSLEVFIQGALDCKS